MPVTHYTALLLALLVLALAGLVLSGHRRREREQREHLRAMREREEKLRLSLWASNELYWQYDLERHELEKVQIQPGSSDDLDVRVDLDADHQIHPDDVDAVLRRLRAYVAGQAPMFLSEHRIQGEDGEWQWMRARGRAVARDEKGRITRIAGTARNVSANREQERERRNGERGHPLDRRPARRRRAEGSAVRPHHRRGRDRDAARFPGRAARRRRPHRRGAAQR